jgi:hypothetical protein
MAGALPRLAMAMIVRDEVDFISANILFHAAVGVDCFIVLDNGSHDGTREALERLTEKVNLQIVDNPDPTFRQGEWSTQLAEQLREQGKADYFFCIDADELMVARQGSLKSAIAGNGPVLSVRRWNMLPLESQVASPAFRFFDATFRVCANPDEAVRASLARQYAPGMLRRVPQKMVSTLAGLNEVGPGSHHFEHSAGPAVRAADLGIFHFPWRPFDQFERKVRFAQYRNAWRRKAGVSVDSRWVRWVDLMERGQLRSEHETFALLQHDAQRLVAAGVLRPDMSIYRTFRPERA